MHKKFFSFYGFFLLFEQFLRLPGYRLTILQKKNYRNNHEHEHTSGVQDNHM